MVQILFTILSQDLVNIAVEQALRDGIASTPDGLSSRSIIADFDLLDPQKQIIPVREWIQPVGTTYQASDVEKDIVIYGDIRDSRDKVVVFTGMRAIQAIVYSSSVTFGTPVAIKGIENMQTLDTGTGGGFGVHQFSSPYMYTAAEDLKIYFHPNSTSVGNNDRIMLMGFVVEQLGTHSSR
jgi:hypothetical protein